MVSKPSGNALPAEALPPVVVLVATSFGKAQSRLGGSSLIVGLALTLGRLTSSLFGYTLTLAHNREFGVL